MYAREPLVAFAVGCVDMIRKQSPRLCRGIERVGARQSCCTRQKAGTKAGTQRERERERIGHGLVDGARAAKYLSRGVYTLRLRLFWDARRRQV